MVLRLIQHSVQPRVIGRTLTSMYGKIYGVSGFVDLPRREGYERTLADGCPRGLADSIFSLVDAVGDTLDPTWVAIRSICKFNMVGGFILPKVFLPCFNAFEKLCECEDDSM